MNQQDLDHWRHDHIFGHDQKLPGEGRTIAIVIVTAIMMIVEIVAGVLSGSMALLADGLHMASHAAALGITVIAYVLARRLARDRRFSFGTGKLNSLAGFTSAVLLGGFALVMAIESIGRLVSPVEIAFDQALIVAVIGLVVNGGSAWLLAATPHHHDHEHHHHDHDEEHGEHHHHGHDHNLRAAYLHVLADALTSVLAIVALLAAKYYGANWLDPVMGLVGAALVANWAIRLMLDASGVLLDRQASGHAVSALQEAIERGGNGRVVDLHLWDIGRGKLAAAITIVSDTAEEPSHYRALIPEQLGVVHATIELHRRPLRENAS